MRAKFQSEWYGTTLLLFLSFSSFLFRSVFNLPTELVVRNGRKSWTLPGKSWTLPGKSWTLPGKSWTLPGKSWTPLNQFFN